MLLHHQIVYRFELQTCQQKRLECNITFKTAKRKCVFAVTFKRNMNTSKHTFLRENYTWRKESSKFLSQVDASVLFFVIWNYKKNHCFSLILSLEYFFIEFLFFLALEVLCWIYHCLKLVETIAGLKKARKLNFLSDFWSERLTTHLIREFTVRVFSGTNLSRIKRHNWIMADLNDRLSKICSAIRVKYLRIFFNLTRSVGLSRKQKTAFVYSNDHALHCSFVSFDTKKRKCFHLWFGIQIQSK